MPGSLLKKISGSSGFTSYAPSNIIVDAKSHTSGDLDSSLSVTHLPTMKRIRLYSVFPSAAVVMISSLRR